MRADTPRLTATGKRAATGGGWRSRFAFDHVKALIVCRGPIRLEAIQVLESLHTQPCGILLSEKDSVVYPSALSPELRHVGRNERVHRIPDYAGANATEKADRIGQIIDICRRHGYTHVFAGYGFMAEDYELIQALEQAGLGFIGPSTRTVSKAGAKDAAKAIARSIGASVTPGIDNVEALTLLAKAPSGDASAFLSGLVREHGLQPEEQLAGLPPEQQAEAVLAAARNRQVELVTIADLQAEAQRQIEGLLAGHPGRRFRLKHIGGGGGKGQRIVTQAGAVPDAVFEVLSEAKATGAGDSRNFLIELNIESTRHNEIQLLGNGDWCIALGGRDCSLQMHEQKLLEASITEEMLGATADAYEREGRDEEAAVLRADREALREMEDEAERFGAAVGLDSASTFESIVDGRNHYFMEMNTRIQVEHRVTEMVYALRFTNPEAPHEELVVDSLVEAMVWMAAHGKALPRPERVPRHGSGVEVRINATNDALKPHAGGIVLNWSPPIENELRDDQGIGLRNPDTDEFMTYHLAGAYDSNIALIVSHGRDREETFERLEEILRRTDLRGRDLHTNLGFHYGLLHWMLGADAMVKPTTRFVNAYLAAVGALHKAGADVELDLAWELLSQRETAANPHAAHVLNARRTMILRPLRMLYAQPHHLAGWLSPRRQRRFVIEGDRVVWRQNPLEVLLQLYQYLRLEPHTGVSPEEQVWSHDLELLDTGLAFYRDLAARLDGGSSDWGELCDLLARPEPPPGMAAELWPRVQAAHRGHQLGLSLLELPVLTGLEAEFYAIQVNRRLEVEMPNRFEDPATADGLRSALENPPQARSNQIVAFTGGTYYARPSPEQPPYVQEGEHVEPGDVVGLLEVMKMFNPVRAEFAGTVTRALVQSETGSLVQKGQPLYELDPDHPVVAETEADREARRRAKTKALVERL